MMDIIPYNVNVMDNKGIIIASGDKDRIDTLHLGAQGALDGTTATEVYKEKAGVKPGVNIPIRFNHRNIGVIGITGNPKIVRPFGELVRVTAELLIQQEYSIEKYIIKNKLKEEYLYEWLHRKEVYDNEFINRGLELNINIEDEGYIVIIDYKKEYAKELKKTIELYFKKELEIVALNASRSCIILNKSIEKINNFIEELLNKGEDKLNVIVILRRTEILSKVFYKGISTINVATALNIKKKVIRDSEAIFYAEIEKMVKNKDVKEVLEKIKIGGEELLDTFKVFVEENFEKGKTSNIMHIHRNTLSYRLSKIEELTGLSFDNSIDTFRLISVYIYYKIYAN
jgi:carbohydrate diacid regulator